jgi:hypothetical protein
MSSRGSTVGATGTAPVRGQRSGWRSAAHLKKTEELVAPRRDRPRVVVVAPTDGEKNA